MVYKRLLTGLFICLFSFLLMSHNTFAVDYGATGSTGYSSGELHYINAYGQNAVVYGVANTTDGMSFASPTSLGATWSIGLSFKTVPSGKFLASIPYRLCFSNPDDMKAWVGFTSNNYYYLISNTWEYTSGGCISGVATYFANGGYSNISFGNSGPILGSVSYSYNFVFGKMSYTLVDSDTDYTSVLNAIKNNTDDIKTKLDQIKESANDALDREESETQDAADASASAGSSAASDSEQATSSLLSTITGFFNAIIGVNPSNCKFNSNLPFLPGNGEIDLCSINTPPIVQTLSSLVLVGLFIPFCIHMFNRFVSITESFQR